MPPLVCLLHDAVWLANSAERGGRIVLEESQLSLTHLLAAALSRKKKKLQSGDVRVTRKTLIEIEVKKLTEEKVGGAGSVGRCRRKQGGEQNKAGEEQTVVVF